MKPLNKDEPTCNPMSSECIIWQGPDIACIKLCKNDTVSDVVYKLATELCDVLDQLDVSGYDLSCLEIVGCVPATFKDFIQVLINKICELMACCGNTTPSQSIFQETITIASCFQYTNPQGDTVTTMTLQDYVTAIGNRICNTTDQTNTNTQSIQSLDTRVTILEDEPAPVFEEPEIVPNCVLPRVSTPVSDVVQALEQQFCELIGATGTANEIYQAIQRECVGLSSSPALSQSGNMSGITGWSTTVPNLAAAIGNIWLTICDMRAAIRTIQINCCPAACEAVTIYMTATMTSTDITLLLTGSIPAGFASCSSTGTLVTISDTLGNSFTTYVDIPAEINGGGYVIDITTTPIEPTSDITITMAPCMYNSSTGTTCESSLSYTIVNSPECISLTLDPDTTSIDYTGASLTGTATYDVQLWNNDGTVLIETQTSTISDGSPVEGTFTGLTADTSYRVRVIVTTDSGTSTCPFQAISTDPEMG